MRDRTLRAGFPAALFLLNAWICWELFRTEYTQHISSIEAAYISISRYIMNNWGDLTWFPLWYCGIPYQNSYPPLLHVIVAAVAEIARWSPALAYHFVTACFYCLGPVALYWLSVRLSGDRFYSFAAGLLYSLVAPSAILVRDIRDGMGGPWMPRRLDILVKYGEGPHVASLALLPLALVALDRALVSRRALDVLLAAVASAAVALTNWLGAFALAIEVLCLLLERTNSLNRNTSRTWLLAGAIGVLAYLLAGPWVPPSTIATIRWNAAMIGADYAPVYRMLPVRAVVGIAAAVAMKLALRRAPPGVQFFMLFSFFMATVALATFWRGFDLVPQPHRYHVEMDLAICGGLVFLARWLLKRLPNRLEAAVLLLALLGVYPQIHHARRFARWWIQSIDIHATTEYKMAKWFDGHMNGHRVLAPGTISFWMNAFTDTPQFGGGFDQGRPYPEMPIGSSFLYSGDGAGERRLDEALVWLKAFGVQAIAVGGPHSGEFYKPFQKPEQFAVLKELGRDGDDVVYEVPLRSGSLAHVIEKSDYARRPTESAQKPTEMLRYVAALDDPARPLADFQWTSRHSARISASLNPGQLISVQETWHAGWHASVNGEPRRVFGDGLGLIVIEPRCEGRCTIDLNYDGGAEMYAAKSLSLTSLLGCLIWAVVERRRAS